MKRLETSIYRLDDGRLYVRTTAKSPLTGKIEQRERTMRPGQTLAEARALVLELKDEITSQRAHSGPDARTIQDYATWWLRQKVGELAPSVRTSYMFALERLCEYMGGVPLDSVVRADVQAWVRWTEGLVRTQNARRMLSVRQDGETKSPARKRVLDHIGRRELDYEEVLRAVRTTRKTLDRMIAGELLTERLVEPEPQPYSTHTLRGWWRVVLIMFRDAKADGLLSCDPTERVRPPTTDVRQVQERETLSAQELGDLVAAAARVAPLRYAEIVTLAYTGMRAGELYGLQWEDVDWAGDRLCIRRTVSKRRLRDTTKTGAARETYMPPIVAEAMRDHHARLLRADELHALVFPAKSGKPRAADTLRRALDTAATEAGIAIVVRPQVLRRTFNTLLVGAGVDRIVQRSMIGHTTEAMTERYAGVRLEDKRAAVLQIVPEDES